MEPAKRARKTPTVSSSLFSIHCYSARSSDTVSTSLLPVLFQLTVPGQYARGYRSYGSLPEGDLGKCKGRLSRETGDGPRSRFVILSDRFFFSPSANISPRMKSIGSGILSYMAAQVRTSIDQPGPAWFSLIRIIPRLGRCRTGRRGRSKLNGAKDVAGECLCSSPEYRCCLILDGHVLTAWRRPSIQLISLSEQSDLNPHLRSIRVVRGKIETPSTQTEITSHLSGDGEADGKVDTIVSEPIGVLLFHERMVSLVQILHTTRLLSSTDFKWLDLDLDTVDRWNLS